MSQLPPLPVISTALPAYAELFCLSNFSFLHGASHAEELVERAIELGYAALAVTDECSLAGVVRAHMAVKNHFKRQAGGKQESEAEKKVAFKLLIGSHFRLTCPDGSSLTLIA
jgi:error-prone DNA polymerase